MSENGRGDARVCDGRRCAHICEWKREKKRQRAALCVCMCLYESHVRIYLCTYSGGLDLMLDLQDGFLVDVAFREGAGVSVHGLAVQEEHLILLLDAVLGLQLWVWVWVCVCMSKMGKVPLR